MSFFFVVVLLPSHFFIFGCAGSVLLLGFSLIKASRSYSQVVVQGLLLFQSKDAQASVVATPRLQRTGSIVPWWLSGKKPPANARDTDSIPDLGRSHVPRGH